MAERLFVGKVARAAGLSAQTVRYYEQLRLLAVAPRTSSGYRVYTDDVLMRLRFIRQAQAVGFRLEEIREILRIRFAGQSPCNCVRELLRRRIREVEKQLRELARFRREIRRTLARSRSLPRLPHRASSICPLIEGMRMAPGRRMSKR